MADTVWSQIVALFGKIFRYSVLFLVFTVFTSIMYFFLQFPFKPPSKIHPKGPPALKPPALRAGFLRGVIISRFTHRYLEFHAARSSRLWRDQPLILNTVRLAPMLAVYVATTMKPKSHQVADTRRPDKFLGTLPPPWGVIVVTQNQKASFRLNNLFSSSSLDKK